MTTVEVMPGQVFTVRIVAPCAWLTSNDRLNRRFSEARLKREWRNAAFVAAQRASLPVGLARVRIDVLAQFRGRPPVRDRDNLRPTIKAVVDGLGPQRRWTVKGLPRVAPGWGLVPDDSDKHVDGPHLDIGERLPDQGYGPSGELLVTITVVQP